MSNSHRVNTLNAHSRLCNRPAEGGAEGLAERLARRRDDLAMLRELDRIDQFRWTAVDGRLPVGKDVAGAYTSFLGKFGLDPGAVGAGAAAARMDRSAVRDRLVAALDFVFLFGPAESVRDALRRLDPDPFREPMRDAAVTARKELARRPEMADQPPAFLEAYGMDFAIPDGQRRAFLRAAVARHPATLPLLMALGGTYSDGPGAGSAERVRWYQAAVAAAPNNFAAHFNLSQALHAVGDLPGTAAALRRAAALDPTCVRTHVNLGIALHATGDTPGALAALQRAVKLDPKYPQAQYNLGVALHARGDLPVDQHKYREAAACARAAIAADPHYANARRLLGSALLRSGDLTGARAAFAEAARLDPKRFGQLPKQVPPPPVAPAPRAK